MNYYLSSVIHYLFIAKCDYCYKILSGKDFNRICLRCLVKLDNTKNIKVCNICFHPLIKFSQINDNSSSLSPQCPSCHDQESPHYGSNKSLFFNYGMPKNFIYDYKFKPHSSYSDIIVYYTLKKFGNYLEQFDGFVPIPIGRKGLFERDFCQVSLVTKKLGKKIKKPVFYPLQRNEKKYRQAQHQLNAQERKASISEKYLYVSKNRNRLDDMNILLVDDIMTTGSTLDLAAKLIRLNNRNVKINAFTFLKTTFQEKINKNL